MTGNLLRKEKCYNATVPVTMFKYLPFNAEKTAHLDRLCLENSLNCLSVCCKKNYIKIKQTQMLCYPVCYK